MAIEYFPRRVTDRPGTRIQTDTSALTGSASPSEKPLMIIGSAEGGQPNTVYRVRSLYDAKNIFRGGELLDALEMAWNPSPQSIGAGVVYAMRAEDASPASLTQGGVEFKSRLYGNSANDIELSLTTGGLEGHETRNLTVSFAPDNYEQVYRNIGHIFSLRKEEDANVGYISASITDGKLTVRIGETADNITNEKEFNLGTGTYAYTNGLVNALNSIDGLNAYMPAAVGDKNINTIGLDDFSEVEITDEEVTVTGVLADLYNQLEYDEYVEVNLNEDFIVSGSKENGDVVVRGNVDVPDFEMTALSGGKTGAIPATWANKIEKFGNENGYYLVPLTDSEAIQAEALAFVVERTNNGYPMRMIAGAGYDETPERLMSRAMRLQNTRAALVGFSIERTTNDGRKTKFPAYMTAALVAGVASGLPIGEAITFKQITISELSNRYDGVQVSALNSSGVIMAEFVRDRNTSLFRIVDDVTTHNNADDPVNNQLGVGEAHDFLVSELRMELDRTFIGVQIASMGASLLKNAVESFLDQKKRDQEIQDYAPEDVQVSIIGEEAFITAVIQPIRNFKRINVSLVYQQNVLSS